MAPTKSQQVTPTESLNLVRNLLSTGLSCITYLRYACSALATCIISLDMHRCGRSQSGLPRLPRLLCSNLFDEANYDDYPQNGAACRRSPRRAGHVLNLVCLTGMSALDRPDAEGAQAQRLQRSGPAAGLVRLQARPRRPRTRLIFVPATVSLFVA